MSKMNPLLQEFVTANRRTLRRGADAFEAFAQAHSKRDLNAGHRTKGELFRDAVIAAKAELKEFSPRQKQSIDIVHNRMNLQ